MTKTKYSYRICNVNTNECFTLNNVEFNIILNGGVFEDCPDESNMPDYDEHDETILGVFSAHNLPIIAHRLKYLIKTTNIKDEQILNFLKWIEHKKFPILIYEE